MFPENAAVLLITFCFSFPGLCFALNKNSMKTPAHVTGTHLLCGGTQQHFFFPVFYLCNQKCSVNQDVLAGAKNAVSFRQKARTPNISQVCMLLPKASSWLPPFWLLKPHVHLSGLFKFI